MCTAMGQIKFIILHFSCLLCSCLEPLVSSKLIVLSFEAMVHAHFCVPSVELEKEIHELTKKKGEHQTALDEWKVL